MVEADIGDGERAVSALEKPGLKVIAAFWSPSEEDWKLVVVSPDVAEKEGPQVYKKALVTLSNLDIEPPAPELLVGSDKDHHPSESGLPKAKATRGDR